VSFGNASGPVPPFALAELNNYGSLFATRPKLNDYVFTRKELLEGAGTLFAAVINGKLHVPINHAYALKDAAKAHTGPESRAATGRRSCGRKPPASFRGTRSVNPESRDSGFDAAHRPGMT
jgi:NADPH2:quinone reductase